SQRDWSSDVCSSDLISLCGRRRIMKSNTPSERLINGIIKENPTFVLMLGMCPTLAITTSATNGIGMGLTTTAVLAASNLMISLRSAERRGGKEGRAR